MAPNIMNGSAAKVNEIFVFEQLSISREIWFPNREHSKVFQAIFVLCLYETRSFILVRIAELVHRSQLTLYFYRQIFF